MQPNVHTPSLFYLHDPNFLTHDVATQWDIQMIHLLELKKMGILDFSYNMVIRTLFLLGEAILSRMLIVDSQGVEDIKTVIFFRK